MAFKISDNPHRDVFKYAEAIRLQLTESNNGEVYRVKRHSRADVQVGNINYVVSASVYQARKGWSKVLDKVIPKRVARVTNTVSYEPPHGTIQIDTTLTQSVLEQIVNKVKTNVVDSRLE